MTRKLYIVGVDGSEWAERATMRAVHLAQETGAEIRLVTVIPWSGFQPMTLEELSHRPLEKREEEKTAKEEILEPLLEKFRDAGIKITGEYYWGHPVETLHKCAKKEHANMIFLGRRGRSRIADLLLGSVSNAMAHTAGVPIVLVP